MRLKRNIPFVFAAVFMHIHEAGGMCMEWEEYVEDLWIERLIWVRQLILSIMLGLRDVGYVAQRVERNSEELGELLGGVFGMQAGKQFEELLKNYILKLTEVATTVKAGQNPDILTRQWYDITGEIADFLSKTNPYWNKAAVYRLIRNQQQLELSFATELRKENYGQGIAEFDPAYDNARQAAQLVIAGIEKYMGQR